MKTTFTRRAPVALALLLSLARPAPAAPSYTVTDLGPMAGHDSFSQGVNARGQVTGGGPNEQGNDRAFIYADGSLMRLKTFGGKNGYAYSINNSGQVSGFGALNDVYAHAFLYSDGTMVDLGTPPGYDSSYGNALSGNGLVAGLAVNQTTYTFTACLYQNGQMTALGTLGGPMSVALGVNNSAQVTGSADTSAGYSHAFLYQNGQMTDLGALPGYTQSQGNAINNSGDIVGTCSRGQGNAVQYAAFLYHTGQMRALGLLSVAVSINNSGQILGGYKPQGQQRAQPCLYSNGVLVPLENLIGSNTGWFLGAPQAISDTGFITGGGSRAPSRRGYRPVLLTPITPLAYLSLPQYAVTGGAAQTATVILTAAAPAGGTIITLKSSNTSVAAVPAQITIAQGETGATFPVTTHSVTAKAKADLTAKAKADLTAGDGNITRMQTLTVNP